MVGPKRELLVKGVINETPVTLQLDTGASTTALSPKTCHRLGLRFGLTHIGAPPLGDGAGGGLAEVKWVFMRKLRFASEIFRLQAAVVFEIDAAGGAIDGVLGMDLLGQYALEVDLAGHRFELYREGDMRFRTAELIAADYKTLAGGQIALAITIDGRPATAILDLGANRTFANAHVALTPDDRDTSISAVISSDRHRMQFRTASDVQLGFGELALLARSVWISDLPIFRTFGLADRPAVILGTDVLADRRIVIDPFSRRVYLSR